MKTVLKQIQDNASDEQKLTFALIASVSVAVLMLIMWFSFIDFPKSGGSANANGNNFIPSGDLNGKKTDQEASVASGISNLKDSFYDLVNKTNNNKTEDTVFEIKPVEIGL